MFMLQNQVVKDWAGKVQTLLKSSASRFTKGKSGTITRPSPRGPLIKQFPNMRSWQEYKLADRLDFMLSKKNAINEGIGFRIQRHGVFRHYGTGKGYKRINGMVVRNGGGPVNRTPSDWFNSVIDGNTSDLANQIATINEDLVVNATRMKIV